MKLCLECGAVRCVEEAKGPSLLMLLLSDKSMIRNGGRLMVISQTPSSALPRHDAYFELDVFRSGFYECLTRRGDVLFELTDAVEFGTSPVTDLARLSLEVVRRYA